jgi:MoaA/NifB/PqqE/SkfB family radical SAM enzyme
LRSKERWEYLSRAPRIARNLLLWGEHRFTFDYMPMSVKGLSWPGRWNMLRAALNLGYRRLRPWNWPLHMQVELTSFCNLRCPVCPVGTGDLERTPQAMDPDLFERLMEEAGPYLLTLALWAWGEPLLHPELRRMLAIARRYPAAVLLSTNGQNLNRPSVQDALRGEPPAFLIVAIDGLCDETNSAYRRGAKLAPALEGARALADWKARTGSSLPVLHFRFLAMKQNEHEIPRIREFAAENGFDMVSIRGLSIIDSTERPHRDLLPADRLLRAYRYEDNRRVRRSDFVCQHAFNFPTVLADGTVVACEQDFNGHHPYGIFSRERSFAGIWFGRDARRVRKVVRDDPEQYSFCRNCPYADRDSSSCSIEGYSLRPLQL